MADRKKDSGDVLADWYSTFKDLREYHVTLQDWLTYHHIRRAKLTEKERKAER